MRAAWRQRAGEKLGLRLIDTSRSSHHSPVPAQVVPLPLAARPEWGRMVQYVHIWERGVYGGIVRALCGKKGEKGREGVLRRAFFARDGDAHTSSFSPLPSVCFPNRLSLLYLFCQHKRPPLLATTTPPPLAHTTTTPTMIHFATSTERDTTPVVEDEEESRLDYFDTRSSQTSSYTYAPLPVPIQLDLSESEDEEDEEDVDGHALDHMSDVYPTDLEESDEEDEDAPPAPPPKRVLSPPPPQPTRTNIRQSRPIRLASTSTSTSTSASSSVTKVSQR